ncbi:type II toxin-antitoxin system RelE/ParE family toxin [Serratia nematodiphila]|uniref:type II toxin-antitoxin system RelE/ParE family toxin n=1 Tax=Serratia nematodiphila TaxID=458197 RepID=UPI0011DBF696|nr:type II toxin-antitoxin system RelE/ParE family toxin [Serratia nematodiphila]TXE57034.1 type II toxin-antitoxin system RelE/ParE family toxin [Serratia nematodiphila]
MWEVKGTDVFDQWFGEQTEALQDEILAVLTILGEHGPNLGRPQVDTLNGSAYTNMKELRIQFAGNPIRAFFAFDPERRAIVLCAGDKTGVNEKKFYKDMIRIADAEYRKHLDEMR